MEAARALTSKGSSLHWFAEWLRAKVSGEAVELEGQRFAVEVVTIGMEVMFPRLWKQLQESREALEHVEPYLAQYGVRFDYGRA